MLVSDALAEDPMLREMNETELSFYSLFLDNFLHVHYIFIASISRILPTLSGPALRPSYCLAFLFVSTEFP